MNILSKFHLPSSSGLGLTVFGIYFHKPSDTDLMNDRGFCRTAPATRGLLFNSVINLDLKSWFVDVYSEHCKSQTRRARELKFGENVHPTPVMCHVGHPYVQNIQGLTLCQRHVHTN